ncbi:5'-nucleotidase SurE [Dirofilaria immitis]
MGDVQKEIQNLWREMVSEMNYALSDDCIKELQAQNLLEIRYHKLRLSLRRTIDAIKEFTKIGQTLVELPPNPFDVENLPQITLNEPALQATSKLPQHSIKSPINSIPIPMNYEKGSTFFNQKNCSISLVPNSDSFNSHNRNHNNDRSSISDAPNTLVASRNITSKEETQFTNPFKYNNRKPEKVPHALQILGNKQQMHDNKYQSYLPESSTSSIVSAHALTYASLSPPAESENNNDRNFKKQSDDSDLNRLSTISQRSDQFQKRAKMLCNGKNFLSNKAEEVTYPNESLEQQRHSVIVVPSPDISCSSSDDEDEVEQERFSNITNNRREMKSLSMIRSDPSCIYAKRSDLIRHKAPSSKQLINVKITWIASQRDFYVTFVNEQKKYNLLERDIYEQNYESLIGRKVEEGEPCMVFKNVDFGGYLMISNREITPMLQQHTQLPMAAIHCAILGAFQVRLKAEAIDAFKKKFPIGSTFKLLFVHKSKHDDVYETQLYLQENMRHDAFLPLEVYCN